MRVDCYLVIESTRGASGRVVRAKVIRATSNLPTTANDLVVKVSLDIDPALFEPVSMPVIPITKDVNPPQPVKAAEVKRVPRP